MLKFCKLFKNKNVIHIKIHNIKLNFLYIIEIY